MSDATFDMHVGKSIFDELKRLREDVGSLRDKVEKVEETSTTAFDSFKKSLKSISFTAVTQGLENLTQGLREVATPGIKFNASMTELSAMSGKTGKELESLGKMARENAKIFGGDASKSVETYKLLIAQLGPAIADTPEVLNAMAQNAEILAKSMNGDVVGAAGVLSTAMHQYNVDLTDASKAQAVMTTMMNEMAASANNGSSELPQLQQAVGVAGGSAKRAGLEFAELLTAVQFLDTASYKASEGGTALRAVLDKLSAGRFLPKDVRDELSNAGIDINALSDKTISFTDKLRMLQPIAEDTALIGKLFGGPYAGAAQALISTADAQDQMTASIKGTTDAQDYANKMMESAEEKQARFRAKIDDIKVSMFELTGGTTAYLEPMSEVMRQVSAFQPLASGMVSVVNKVRKSEIAQIAVTKAGIIVRKAWNSTIGAYPPLAVKASAATSKLGTEMKKTDAASKASSTSVKNFGSILKGIGWMAIAAGVAAVATKIYDIASGAEAARFQLEQIDKGKQRAGDFLGNESDGFSALLANRDKEISRLQDRETAGEISPKQRIADEIAIRKKYLNVSTEAIEGEQSSIRSKKNAISQVQSDVKNGKISSKSNSIVSQWINGVENTPEGIIASITGQIEESEQIISGIKSHLEEGRREIERLEAEQKGSKIGNIPGLSTPPSQTLSTATDSGKGGNRNINVRIDRLIENITIQTSGLKEGMTDVKKQVTEAIVGAVRDFEIAI